MKKVKYTDFTDDQKKEISKKLSNNVKGRLWFTNGIKDIRQTVDKKVPDGYYLGRTSNKK